MTSVEMPITEGVIIAIISAVSASILALIGWIGKIVYETRRTATSVKKDSKGIRHQVENDHKINLRDDVDNKHNEVIMAITELKRSVGGLHDDVRILHTRDNAMREDISILARAINGEVNNG